MKKIVLRLIILAVVCGLGYGAWRLFQAMPERQSQVANTKVRKGDVVVRTFARGEIRAVRSVTLNAPNLFGTVQVTDSRVRRIKARFSGSFCEIFYWQPYLTSCMPDPNHPMIWVEGTVDMPL
jgi:hypothetical protein